MRAKGGKERFSLARWSRRKLEAATKPVVPAPAPAATPFAAAAPELPPIDSLSFDSDFSVFLRPGVDGELKQAALKKLFRDPRFNVMDGLDTYIDDYTKADPIAPDVLADLLQRFGGPAEAEQAPVAATTASPEEPLPEPEIPALGVLTGESGATPLVPAESAELAGTGSASPSSQVESERAQRAGGGDVSARSAGEQH